MPDDYYLELIRARVAPADRPWTDGILVEGGTTLPFLVERSWSGPAGTYVEQWSVRQEGRGVVHESPARYITVRGMQSVTQHVERVDRPIAIEPGSYDLVFIVEGYFMGSAKVEVLPAGQAVA